MSSPDSAPFDALAVFEAAHEAALAPPADGSPAVRVARAEERVAVGLLDEAASLLDAETDAVSGEHDGLAARFELLVARSRLADAAALGTSLEERAASSAHAAAAHVRLLLLREDLEALDRWAGKRPAEDPVRLLAEAEIAARLNDVARADSLFERALAAGARPGEALLGRSRCALRDDRVDDARRHCAAALRDLPRAASLGQWAQVLVKSGEATRAVLVYERLAGAFPWDETAHYQLGNGYSRLSYTELEKASPAAFPRDGAFVQAMADVRTLIAGGRREAAAETLARITAAHAAACEPPAVLASLAWDAGRLDESERWCRESLAREPRYGRAHAILAKVLDSRRMLLDVHRERDEAAFAKARMPEIPGIETFVTNWRSLDARHQKRVALSVAPWSAFVPVLVEGGQTYTIKLLHERLSETPGHESLRDQRISYDARLWDDVRGCGGTDTVTSIEDVERTIFRRYDTVLHELTHQVHGILSEEDKAAIERAYTDALARDAKGEEAFVNRYQASSVWEYFAEGVHASRWPRRDRWDTREMSLERVRELDPALLALARRFTRVKDATRYLPGALANRAWKEVEYARLAEARTLLERAAGIDPVHEGVLEAWTHVECYAGEPARGLEIARRGLAAHPESAALALAAATAELHASGDRAAALAVLESARPLVDPGRRQDVENAIGWLTFEDGRHAPAAATFRAVLAAREDDPEALVGLVAALAFEPGAGGAEMRDALTRLVRKRAGSRDVRAGAAIALARAGDLYAARQQVAEGLLNAPESDTVLAAAAYVEHVAGRGAEAAARAREAMAFSREEDGGSWNDLAALVEALSALASDDRGAAAQAASRLRERSLRPPSFQYVEREHEWRSVHRFGPLERELLAELEGAIAATAER